jgi:hypothetical protein
VKVNKAQQPSCIYLLICIVDDALSFSAGTTQTVDLVGVIHYVGFGRPGHARPRGLLRSSIHIS